MCTDIVSNIISPKRRFRHLSQVQTSKNRAEADLPGGKDHPENDQVPELLDGSHENRGHAKYDGAYGEHPNSVPPVGYNSKKNAHDGEDGNEGRSGEDLIVQTESVVFPLAVGRSIVRERVTPVARTVVCSDGRASLIVTQSVTYVSELLAMSHLNGSSLTDNSVSLS